MENDAWNAVRSRLFLSGKPPGIAANRRRPANFQELAELTSTGVDWDTARDRFLHEFFRYRNPEFFEIAPPDTLSPECRALLAGMAEFLCAQFGFSIPPWVSEPGFTLPEMWDPASECADDAHLHQEARAKKAHPVFLKHGVIFESVWLLDQAGVNAYLVGDGQK